MIQTNESNARRPVTGSEAPGSAGFKDFLRIPSGDVSRVLPRNSVIAHVLVAVPVLVGLPLLALWASSLVDPFLPVALRTGVSWLFVPGLLLLACGFVFWLYSPFLLVVRGRGIPIEGFNGPTFTPTSTLVITGPYRYVRNPMYAGYLSIIAALGMVFGSPTMLFLVFPLWCWQTWNFTVRHEEIALAARFGDSYRDYVRAVPRFIPTLKPFPKSSQA